MDVVAGYENKSIPLETIWLDIPYLNAYADFTVNTTAFPDIKNYIDMLHSYNKRLVCIVDGGISADDRQNKYYQQGNSTNAFIKSAINDTFDGNLVQKVWPNHTVFLDWFSPNASVLWFQGLKDLYDQLPFDGLWIDMNEATGFCSGECYDGNATILTCSKPTLESEEDKTVLKRFLEAVSSQVGDVNSWYYSHSD
jgi:alpha-glucosidase (family GH31 glycosyl hydrolase)